MGDGDVELGGEELVPVAERMGLAGVVGPDLDVGVGPAGLVEVLQEPPYRLLGRDAPEEPLRPPRHRAGHLLEVLALGAAEHQPRYHAQPELLVALEDLVGNVGHERGGDVGRRRAELVGVERSGKVGHRRLQHQLAVFARDALGELLPAGERRELIAVAVRHRDVAELALRRHAGEAQVAVEARALLGQPAGEHQPPQAEREGERAGEPLVAAPEREAADHGLHQERIHHPQREAGEDDVVRDRRHDDLVVDAGLAPGGDEGDAAQAAAAAESLGVDVATRPVHRARTRQRRRRGGARLRRRVGEDDRRLHHRPGVGGVRLVVADLHLHRELAGVGGGYPLGADEEPELPLLEGHHAPAGEVLDPPQRAVGGDEAGGLGHHLRPDRQRQQHQPLEVGVGIAQLARAQGEVAEERQLGEAEHLGDLDGDAGACVHGVGVGDERVHRAEVELALAPRLLGDRRGALRGLGAAPLGLGEERRPRERRAVGEQRQPREEARKAHLGRVTHLERKRGVEVELLRVAALEEPGEVHLRAQRREVAERVLQLQGAGAVDGVERDRRVLLAAQRVGDGG